MKKEGKDNKMKRSRMDIIYAVLKVSTEGLKKTHIMYLANLSHRQLESSLELLITERLLEKDGDVYRTTAKGLQFIDGFSKVQSLVGAASKKPKRIFDANTFPRL